jgi:hypothetical protein
MSAWSIMSVLRGLFTLRLPALLLAVGSLAACSPGKELQDRGEESSLPVVPAPVAPAPSYSPRNQIPPWYRSDRGIARQPEAQFDPTPQQIPGLPPGAFRPYVAPTPDGSQVGGYRFRPQDRLSRPSSPEPQPYYPKPERYDPEPEPYYPEPGYQTYAPESAGRWERGQYEDSYTRSYTQRPEYRFRPQDRSKRSAGKRWTGNYPAPLQPYSPETYGQWSSPPVYPSDPYGSVSRAPERDYGYPGWSRGGYYR